MNTTLRLVTGITAGLTALSLAACAGPATPATTTPAPTAERTPAASAPATPTAAPAPTQTPKPATPAPTKKPATPKPTQAPAPAERPTIRGEAGGVLTVDGEQVGRSMYEGTDAFLKRMGTPDETVQSTTCGKRALRTTTHRWGDLQVVVLDEEEKDYEYGFSFPTGEIGGWLIDPSLDGKAGLSFPMTGPEGIAIGTPLATLEKTFTTDDWDYAGLDGTTFSIFAGDTTGASFDLDADQKVTAMSAGYSCEPLP